MTRSVTIVAQDACAIAFQVCRTSAGRPLENHYTTTPPRKLIFPGRDKKLMVLNPRFSRAVGVGQKRFRRYSQPFVE